MKQKLALCCALIHKPTILFLDEPTTGVDPVSRKEFWEMLKRLKAQGITIMVSTPYMDEATLCDRIALIDQGKILSIETPQNITNSYPDQLYAVKAENMYALLKTLSAYNRAADSYAFGEYAHVSFREAINENLLKDYLREKGLTGVELKQIEATIEDCFINLLKK